MKRTPLSIGSTIQAKGGSSYTYIIDCVIGDGASSIVYEAHYIDNAYGRHDVRLKECYPYAPDIQRIGTELVWADAESATNDKVAFTTAYHKLLDFQNTTKLRNSTAHIFDLCEANGTLYSVMDVNEGQTFEQDNSEKLSDILKTTLALTHVVEKYHNNGYLHLDIKPNNFLVIPETRELVILFDVDSVTSMADIASGKVKCVSYSKGWAAPEQMQGRIEKLCPATDIYSIGAILFQKVMGRAVENEDIGIFADWNFDGEMFDMVNPKIKRLLKEIFRKSLSANIKRRYQSVDELIATLETAVECVRDGAPYLISDCPRLATNFVGRTTELVLTHTNLYKNNKVVFLHGEAGMGKSSLALAYADRYKDCYDAVIFKRYRGSLKELLNEILIQNFEGDNYQREIVLQRVFNKSTLLIIDNFDVEIDYDDYLEDLFNCNAKILITTRTNFSSILSGNICQVEVEKMELSQLTDIFCYAGNTSISNKSMQIFLQIAKLVDYNTYAIELLGAQIRASGYTIEQLFDKVRNGMLSIDNMEKINVRKDGRIVKRKITDIIRVLFNIADLLSCQIQALRNLCLLGFFNIDRNIYRRFVSTESEQIDILNDLVETNLVRFDGLYYSLHPLIEEIIQSDFTPNVNNCKAVYGTVETIISSCCHYDYCDEASEYEYENNCELLCSFFNSIDLSESYNRSLLINWLLGIIENSDNCKLEDPVHSCFAKLYFSLDKLVSSGIVGGREKFDIHFILLKAWIDQFHCIYLGSPEQKEKWNNLRVNSFVKYFDLACESCACIDQQEQEDCLDLIFDAIIEKATSSFIVSEILPQNFMRDLYEKRPQSFEFLTAYDKNKMGLPLTAPELKELEEYESNIPAVFKPGYTDDDIEAELSCKKGFYQSEDKTVYIDNILSNVKLTPSKRAEFVWFCTDSVFDRLYTSYNACDISNWNLNELEEILNKEEDFLISDICINDDGDTFEDWNMYIESNTINQIIIYAAQNNTENFEKNMRVLLDDLARTISFYIQKGFYWSEYVDIQSFHMISLYKLNNALRNIGKSHLILPHLVSMAEKWQKYVEEKQYDERALFPLYKTIVECAEDAEMTCSASIKHAFYNIEYKYRDKMDSIAGKDFTFKIKDT